MVVKDEVGYVFYCGGADRPVAIGRRSIRLKQLTNWRTEGGTTIDMTNYVTISPERNGRNR